MPPLLAPPILPNLKRDCMDRADFQNKNFGIGISDPCWLCHRVHVRRKKFIKETKNGTVQTGFFFICEDCVRVFSKSEIQLILNKLPYDNEHSNLKQFKQKNEFSTSLLLPQKAIQWKLRLKY